MAASRTACCGFIEAIIIAAKEVMLASGLRKNYSVDLHRIRWQGGTGRRKKRLDFGGKPEHVS